MTDLEKELVEKIGAVARAAVELAIIRTNLRPEGEVDFDEATTAKIAEDAWNACQGIDSCYEEPCSELKALCSYTDALVAAAYAACAEKIMNRAAQYWRRGSATYEEMESAALACKSLTPADAARELERRDELVLADTIIRFRKMLNRLGIHGYYNEMKREFDLEEVSMSKPAPVERRSENG